MSINVWLCGPFGKMGSQLRIAIEETDDISITALISPEHVGEKVEVKGLTLETFETLEAAKESVDIPDVIIDFTVAQAAYRNALFSASNGVNFVSGTTGLTEDQKQDIINAFEISNSNAIIASNFSVGAVLMMHFAAQAAKHFSHAEIVEIHHTQKKDAPSGTALTTQKMMVESSNFSPDDIPMHSLRLPGAIAHQQVHLSSQGEVLRIEHDANDRSCFMPGIILSAREVKNIDGVSFSIEPLLFPESV